MGKGKGDITRSCMRVKKFRPFIYFKGYYDRSVDKVARHFSTKTQVYLYTYNVNQDRLLFNFSNSKHPYAIYSVTESR